MADDPRKDLEKARKTLIEMRHNWVKAIAAGYQRGQTEDAIKGIIEVQNGIEVIDLAMQDLDDADEQEDDEDEE
jgi:hypothetical protein